MKVLEISSWRKTKIKFSPNTSTSSRKKILESWRRRRKSSRTLRKMRFNWTIEVILRKDEPKDWRMKVGPSCDSYKRKIKMKNERWNLSRKELNSQLLPSLKTEARIPSERKISPKIKDGQVPEELKVFQSTRQESYQGNKANEKKTKQKQLLCFVKTKRWTVEKLKLKNSRRFKRPL